MDWGQEREAVEERLREICVALPEVLEGPAFNGRSWLIRKNHFCQVHTIDEGDEQKGILIFRSQPPELDALVHAGHPFFKPGWGTRVMGMVIDDGLDWDEVAELITDSYCIQAPKKLAARVNVVSHPRAPGASDPGIVASQVEYYRARAPEYDEYYERTGPFDLGTEGNRAWRAELALVEAWLEPHVRGSVLDVAAGTGWWTERLARHADRVVALDAAGEMLAINRARNAASGVAFVESDVFTYQPQELFDTVFFGFWLSHVPADHLVEFWNRLGEWLAPGGEVLVVDNMESSAPWIQERPTSEPDTELMTRRLNDGRTFTIVKTHWDPDSLGRRLSEIGWIGTLDATAKYFVFGSARPTTS